MFKEKWVLIADIVDSKKIDNRAFVQAKLEKVLEEINDKYVNDIICPFHITLGDEFVGVLKTAKKLLSIILYINKTMDEIKFRYGIGFGDIIYDKKVLSGGSGYEQSINAIKEAKENNFPVVIKYMEGINKKNLKAQESLLHLYLLLLENLSPRQKEILYYLVKDKKQKFIAEELKISQSAVSQAVKNVNWRLLKKVYKHITSLNSLFPEEDNYKYIAIIGCWDTTLTNSLEMNDYILNVNENYKRDIISNFTITAPSGILERYHEFQGLLNITDNLPYLITNILLNFKNIYLGVGAGQISTKLKNVALGMDGSAFYRAREALNVSINNNINIQVRWPEVISSQTLSYIFILFNEFISSWTDNQREVIKLKQQGLSHTEIANRLGVSNAAVSDRVKRGRWKSFKYLMDSISRLV